MKRVSLKQQFHGEGESGLEGAVVAREDKDEVTMDVVGGSISFVVPSDAPDKDVFQNAFLERYLNGTLQLENGKELSFWITAGASGIDIRALRSRVGKRKGPRPNRK
jgi:hypothetical protein